jgi:two-component system, OmpR family, sensor kinase
VSLRRRLNLAYVGFFAIALLALDLGIYAFVRQSLMDSIDSELQLGFQLIQQDFAQNNQLDGNRIAQVLTKPDVTGFENTSLFVQVHNIDKDIIAQSPNLGIRLPLDDRALERAITGQSTFGSLKSTGKDTGINLRVLVSPLAIQDPSDGKYVAVAVVMVGQRIGETERALTLLAYTLIGGGIVVLLAAARGASWLTRAAFRPIDEVVRTAQGIVSAADLQSRVPVPANQDELQRLTVTINDLLARLQELFQTQRRFMADVSHELRTPLAAMQGNIEVLERGAARDPELLHESLTDMRREVGRLIRMTNDLLLLGQTETGLQLRRDPVELDTLLLEILRELRPLAGEVKLRLGAEDQALALGDRDRLKQALLNLGVNAIQHTPAGGTVTLGLTRTMSEVVISVSDTGSGIAPEALPHIFERFYRADPSRNRNRGGSGLGLSIVKWIAEGHGGRVTAKSTPGAGSTFELVIPLQPTITTQLPVTLPPLQPSSSEVAAERR